MTSLLDMSTGQQSLEGEQDSSSIETIVQIEQVNSSPAASLAPTDHDQVQASTPLPKFQLLIIYLIQFAEPITATVIYPFVNQFVRDTGITGGDERKTGYYAGIVGSVFFLSEAATVFHWGQLSDRIGRKPVLLLGPIGLAFSIFFFGLSTVFWALVTSRALQGVFNGVLGVSKTMIAELTDETNIGDAYAVMTPLWSIGITIGPSIGGLLAEPAKRWPTLFDTSLFRRHPYFLPCAVSAGLAGTTAILGVFGLRETYPSGLRRQDRAGKGPKNTSDQAEDENTTLLGESDSNTQYHATEDQERQTTQTSEFREPIPFRDLLTPQVLITLLVFTFQAFNTMAGQILQPLIYSTSIPAGGLGLSAYEIGLILTAFGFVNAVFQLGFMGYLMRRYGARAVQISNHVASLLHMLLYPPLILTVRNAGRLNETAWTIIVIQHLLRLAVGLGWGSAQILVVNSAPSRGALGATNGLAQAVGCATRAVAPAVASSLYSLSIETQYMDGHFGYFVLTLLAIAGVWTSLWLPKLTNKQM